MEADKLIHYAVENIRKYAEILNALIVVRQGEISPQMEDAAWGLASDVSDAFENYDECHLSYQNMD
jgi:hypothetical protein